MLWSFNSLHSGNCSKLLNSTWSSFVVFNYFCLTSYPVLSPQPSDVGRTHSWPGPLTIDPIPDLLAARGSIGHSRLHILFQIGHTQSHQVIGF